MQLSPEDIQIKREPSGRPEIVHPESGGLRFNLAHSGSLGLVGISANTVGVDIEKIRHTTNVERLATRFFSPDEASTLRQLPETDRITRFFRLWVLKEAYLKSIGESVPTGLSKCDIALEASGPRILRSEFETQGPKQVLVEIPTSKGYVAALAVPQHDADISVFDL